MKAPWLTAAGFPERVALIHMFTSPRWRMLAMSDDIYVYINSIAEFHQCFPLEARFVAPAASGSQTVKSSAAEIEYRLGNPEGIATPIAN